MEDLVGRPLSFSLKGKARLVYEETPLLVHLKEKRRRRGGEEEEKRRSIPLHYFLPASCSLEDDLASLLSNIG